MTPDESDQIDFLLTRYGQLAQEHGVRNQVVHRTFYLSLIFGVALLGLHSRANTAPERGVLAALGTLIFFSLGLWTRSYINGRNDTQRQKDAIIDELRARDCDFRDINSVGVIFPSSEERDDWEDRWKDPLLQCYYAIITFLSLLIGVGFAI